MFEVINKTARSMSALLLCLATAACSHAPVAHEPILRPDPVAENIAPSEADALQQAADALAALDPAPTESPADLFARIRHGYGMFDIDNPLVDRETSWYVNHPDYLDRTFRRGERYLHYIVGELEARKMPLELALLPVVESAFNPIAYSTARAAGLWQFIPATGTRYGLKQNFYYDGRRDVIEGTRAALDYLQFLANEFDGDWMLAVAAYNAGEMNVSRAVERNKRLGKPTDFFSLDLPRETEAYVPKLLAMRRIINEPMRYGLDLAPIQNSPYFVKVDCGGQLDLSVAAELADLPREELLALNPGFSRAITDPQGPHYLLLPADREDKFRTALAELPDSKRIKSIYHQVKRGETLASVARRYGVSAANIKATNNLTSNKLHPGQDLIITPNGRATVANFAQLAKAEMSTPVATRRGGVYTVRPGETLWGIAHDHGITAEQLAAQNGLGKGESLHAGRRISIPAATTLASTGIPAEARQQRMMYTVRNGDTLARVARSFRVNVNDIVEWNKLGSPNDVRPGQRLMLYVDGSSRSGG